jgi:CheY-like chemotaxis protein
MPEGNAMFVRELTILIAEDDEGHARLIERNLRRGGLHNSIERFADGQQVLDYLFSDGTGRHFQQEHPYLLLLDIRMPKVDGIEALERIKVDARLRKVPVIMLTTTDDPREVERCYALGCNNYIVKPVDYEKFCEVIRSVGLFISLVQVPTLDAELQAAQNART